MILHCTMKYDFMETCTGDWKIDTYNLAFLKEGKKWKSNKERISKLKKLVLKYCYYWENEKGQEDYGRPYPVIIKELEDWKAEMLSADESLLEQFDKKTDCNTVQKINWYKDLLENVKEGRQLSFVMKKVPSLKTQEDIVKRVEKELDEARHEGIWEKGENPMVKHDEIVEKLKRCDDLLKVWRD